ncbi:class II fructose-bisphosphate aldolase [Rhodobacteraceae bacterium 2CG4]|uniref:Class II fructose-bisphosphate aldolase n=1 Tax=Halovulum marinum TaxID=2662447 RepID=A0A6L5Z3U9_9RHOB|nr:class II fructose-bisphosphate aldolase [Halovulum marinum]MSU91271.1 class II fructose-bisphosphate aldolase [Halovulum marinum]
MIATLAEVLPTRRGALAGLVVLGWEDAAAFVKAAAAEGLPVILQAGPGARAHMPLPVWGAMFRTLAEGAAVPVVAHLDHSRDIGECRAAIEAGFTSVMFDGSRLPLAENIRATAEVVAMAHAQGVSVEGEVGFVGYDAGEASARTTPADARAFAVGTGVDAMAVSVGNVHLQTSARAEIDFDAVRAIEAVTDVPLVLHGGSGIPAEVRRRLALETRVAKFNVGTELRQVFGASLRAGLAAHPERFDRLAIMSEVIAPMQDCARGVMRNLAG